RRICAEHVNAYGGHKPCIDDDEVGNGRAAYPVMKEEHTMAQKITPNLWFDNQAEEAAHYYVSIFKNSEILDVIRYSEAGPGPAGTVLTVSFRLGDQEFMAINGGPHFTFSEAVSFAITCESQDEVDYYWNKLTEGGEES